MIPLLASAQNRLRLNRVQASLTLHSACSIFEEVGVLQHGIKEDVARVHVFAGDHPEDVEVLGTVGQGQFNLHAVVVGIGEDAVLRKFVQAECKVKQALT